MGFIHVESQELIEVVEFPSGYQVRHSKITHSSSRSLTVLQPPRADRMSGFGRYHQQPPSHSNIHRGPRKVSQNHQLELCKSRLDTVDDISES